MTRIAYLTRNCFNRRLNNQSKWTNANTCFLWLSGFCYHIWRCSRSSPVSSGYWFSHYSWGKKPGLQNKIWTISQCGDFWFLLWPDWLSQNCAKMWFSHCPQWFKHLRIWSNWAPYDTYPASIYRQQSPILERRCISEKRPRASGAKKYRWISKHCWKI